VRQAADEAVRLIHVEAANTRDPDRRKEIARWALQSESRVRIVNMIELAKHRLAVSASELDGHPDLLPCENGVVDLRTGALQPHEPTLRLTKMVEVVYDPGAECPVWEAFLRLITCGDTDLAHFLQVAIGYSLTGRTDEQCFFLLYGQGRNGKTTFVEAIRRLAGDYATKISVEALLAHRNGNGATPDVANLRGARFAVASEIPQQRSLNESLVKDLTGGDTLVARHLYGNPFTFTPTHKLWLFGNHKPTIRGDDLGIWRRVKMILFKAIIPATQQRPMSEVLAEFDQERSGILRWAVDGAIEWYRSGLPRCAAVDQASEDYRSESDLVTQFLAECCEAGVDCRVAKAELYATFRQWLSDQYGEKAPGQRWLTTRLLQRGYQLGGHSRGEVIGLQLRQTFGA
jgi:putative DNA primase/helicase